MATLEELHSLADDELMLKKVYGAIMLAGHGLLKNAPDVNERAWGKHALYNPTPEALKAWRYILAENSAFTVAQITGAGEQKIIDEVNSVVPELVLALAKV